jgi:hypothetical protein
MKSIWRFILFIYFMLILLPLSSIAQTTFERTYGGMLDDFGFSVQQTIDRGYIILGSTSLFGPGSLDFYFIKTDSLGDTLWTMTYGGTDSDAGYSVQQTLDGGYILTGSSSSFGPGTLSVYLIKTDSSGDTQWTRSYGGDEIDFSRSVIQTLDGGYIISGGTTSFGAGFFDVYLIKTNSQGESLWTKTYGDTGSDASTSVQQTFDGGYIITGWKNYFSPSSQRVYLVKTDSKGDTLWTKTYGGSMSSRGNSVQQTSDGGYIITGYTYSSITGSYDVYLIKTDSNGDTLWTKTYGGTDSDEGNSVQQTFDGGYVVAGKIESTGTHIADVYLIKTDPSGDTQWTRTYGGSSQDEGFCIQQTFDGGYIITGMKNYSLWSDTSDVYLIKTDENGLVVGIEEKVEDKLSFKTSKLILLQNQPNPFNISTSIRYQIPYANNVTLSIYDINGRLRETLLNEYQKPGIYQVKWEGNNQASGIYFYQLRSGAQTQIRKLTFVK